MIGDDTTNYRVNAWIRSKNNGLFVKPRLFTPYAEEIKVCSCLFNSLCFVIVSLSSFSIKERMIIKEFSQLTLNFIVDSVWWMSRQPVVWM